MESSIEVLYLRKLALNEEEVDWLKGILQNPIGGVEPSQEAPNDVNMRRHFWEALGGD